MKTLSVKSTRRFGVMLCIFCILLSLFMGYATVSAQGTAKIDTTSIATCNEKGVTTVRVSYGLTENSGIWGLKFKSGYNHEVMTLKAVEIGNVFTAEEVTMPQKLDKEQFVFAASGKDLKNISTNGTLVTLVFEVKSGADVEENPVTVQVVQAINVDGKDVKIDVTNHKVSTGEAPTENRVKGDVNGDKAVTLQDAQIALKVALRIENLKDNTVADVNGDKAVTLQDAQIILKIALKIPV